MTKNENIIR